MNKILALIIVIFVFVGSDQKVNAKDKIDQQYPIGIPGLKLKYSSEARELSGSVIRKIELTLGAVEEIAGVQYQWILMHAQKENGQTFSVWMLSSAYPSESLKIAQEAISRYIISKADSKPIEFVNQNHGTSALPNTGAWKHLLPRSEKGEGPINSKEKIVKFLGLEYTLDSLYKSDIPTPPKEIITIHLTPDLLIGVPHNTKVKDEIRRYDESDYEYVELTKENYLEMIENGINVFNFSMG